MRDKQMEVLAQLMFYNNKYKHLDQEVRDRILFDADTKMRIRQKLKMSDGSFNNNMSELRKKKVIVGNALAPACRIFLSDTPEELVFKFVIKESDDADNSHTEDS
jgi:hypothetical protein